MKQRILWAALVLAVIITIVWPLIPFAGAEKRLAAIPTSGPEFKSQSLPLSPEDISFLGKASAIQHLISLRSGGRLVLTVIDGSHNRHAVHDPAYCFSGAGWKIINRKSVQLNSGQAVWVSLTKDGESTEALWFYDDGGRQFTSPLTYWLRTGLRRATLGTSGPEPVLVTLRAIPGATIDWERARHILLPELGFQ